MQAVVGRRALEKQAASTNTLSRFETEVLSSEENLSRLRQLNAEWVERAMSRTPHQRVILDMIARKARCTDSRKGLPITVTSVPSATIPYSASTSLGTARGQC